MNVFNAHAYRECLNTARSDLADALSERYALYARLDEAGNKLTQLRLRLGVAPKPEKLSQLRKVKGLTRAVEEYCAVLARLDTADKRIDELQAWIRQIYADAEASQRVLCDDVDLKEAICTALRYAGFAQPIPVLVRILKHLQFPFRRLPDDPLDTVAAAAAKLAAERKIVRAYRWAKTNTYYRAKRKFTLFSFDLWPRPNQGLRKKESKKRA